jgi:hypothetical protein
MVTKKLTKQMIGKVLVSASMALIAVGLAAPATAAASPVQKQLSAPDFLAAARATGITGTDPAMLEDGYNVCWELWRQHSPANQVAAGMQKDYPTLTFDQAAHFVIDAYQDLCPVPGAYDYWAYSTSAYNAARNQIASTRVTPAPPAPAAVAGPLDAAASGGTGVHIASLTGCVDGLNC